MISLGDARPLHEDEIRLLNFLLDTAASAVQMHKDSLANRMVVEMGDGGMGSLRFAEFADRNMFPIDAAAAIFKDADEVPVWATLLTTQLGELYELDMFKGDSSPLVKIPSRFEVLPPASELYPR